jgi:hypothetical protein
MPKPSAEEEVDRLFDRIARLTDSQLMMLRSAWEESDATARERAWRQVKAVVAARQLERELDDARSRLGAWVNNYLSATAAEYGNFLINPGSGMDAATVRRQALPPLLDAIAATVAAGHLTADDRESLLEPLAGLDRD